MDYTVHGILQARILEWVAVPFSRDLPNPGAGLPHGRRILYQLSQKGSPRILEWVAYPFSSTSSQLRNWTTVSCIAGRFFTNWAIRKAPTFASSFELETNQRPKDTPHPRSKEKPQQDGRGGEITFRIKPHTCQRPGFNPWVGNIPWRREQLPTPVFWPGEFHGLSMGLPRVGHDWVTKILHGI